MLACLLPAFLSAQSPATTGDGPAVVPTPQQIIDSNTLTGPGKRPFYLKLSFQLYSLSGKPSEQGVLEEWWRAPDLLRLQVTTPSLGTVSTTRSLTPMTKSADPRASALIAELLSAVQVPGVQLSGSKDQIVTEGHKEGSAFLQCMHSAGTNARSGRVQLQVCYAGSGPTIRVLSMGDQVIIRNKVAHFGEEWTALDTTVSWVAREAITGHIEQLRSLAPGEDPFVAEQPAATPGLNAEGVHISGSVLAGSKIGGAVPVYPEVARQERISGTVVLLGVIGEDGRVKHLWPLASSDESLTASAMDAVSTWVYQPYLLNGKPTSVTTDVTIHFNMNQR